ncbi:MAG TPA: septal ring lytic transglycosylase RlpA family protein [Kiloniellaceae bacterium]
MPEAPAPKPAVAASYTGLASWYGAKFHGRLTASGERYDMAALTAAHQTLPFGSRVRVTNLANSRFVEVVINDRGPFAEDRLIDLSRAAAKRLGIVEDGVAEVRIEVLSDGTNVAG